MDWLAAVFGVLGSILLCVGTVRLIPYAFTLHLLGSIFWLAFGVSISTYSLCFSNIVFIVIEAVGIIRWLRVNKYKKYLRNT